MTTSRTPSAGYPRAVLALTMGLSTWLNVTHAAVSYPGTSWRWAILGMAAIPPLAVPVLIELVGREARRGGATAAFLGAMGAAVLLTLIAFAVSVWAITSLGMRWGMPLVVAAAFPLVLDLGAAVATLFLLDRAAAEARAAGGDAAADTVTTTAPAPTTAPELAYPDSLTWMTAPATASLAADGTHVTQVPETSHHPAAIPVTSADEAVVDPAPAATARAMQLVADAPAVDVPASTADHHAAAAELVADGVFKAGREERLATALALIEARPEMSQREIARLAGVDRTVVKKLLDARMTTTG